MNSVRAFLAVDLPKDVKDAVARQFLEAAHPSGGMRWTSRGNLHLTLKFFGSLPEERTGDLKSFLGEFAPKQEPFFLSFAETGVFPNNARPQALWLGAGKGKEDLEALVCLIEDGFAEIGFSKQTRVFHPHLTLAKLNGKIKKAEIERFLKMDGLGISGFIADRLVLFKSQTLSSGPVYSVLDEFKFGASG